ncbi:hypothetical protein Cni_G20610 [Canna indica]|uniref:Polygalacturonase n=1 Tax=Canna indica TaxID=4628 RepID=A0AAQ3KTH2_9LILI|nr:hypothetical protein Cni_G20610 [Canna indica]
MGRCLLPTPSMSTTTTTTFVIDYCERVLVHDIRITAAGSSPNTDGIHVQGSNHVTITNVGIRTGDHCISIAPGTTNFWIKHVACDPGHGISLGKGYEEKGVENVTVKMAVFTRTHNGLRIKTWGRPGGWCSSTPPCRMCTTPSSSTKITALATKDAPTR